MGNEYVGGNPMSDNGYSDAENPAVAEKRDRSEAGVTEAQPEGASERAFSGPFSGPCVYCGAEGGTRFTFEPFGRPDMCGACYGAASGADRENERENERVRGFRRAVRSVDLFLGIGTALGPDAPGAVGLGGGGGSGTPGAVGARNVARDAAGAGAARDPRAGGAAAPGGAVGAGGSLVAAQVRHAVRDLIGRLGRVALCQGCRIASGAVLVDERVLTNAGARCEHCGRSGLVGVCDIDRDVDLAVVVDLSDAVVDADRSMQVAVRHAVRLVQAAALADGVPPDFFVGALVGSLHAVRDDIDRLIERIGDDLAPAGQERLPFGGGAR